MRCFAVHVLSLGALLIVAQPSYGWWIFHHPHHKHGSYYQAQPMSMSPMVAAPLTFGLPGGFSFNLDGHLLNQFLQNRGGGQIQLSGQTPAQQIVVAPEVRDSLQRIEITLTSANDGVDKLNKLIAEVNAKKLPDGTLPTIQPIDALKSSGSTSPDKAKAAGSKTTVSGGPNG